MNDVQIEGLKVGLTRKQVEDRDFDHTEESDNSDDDLPPLIKTCLMMIF